jgi:hypothetical protein
MNRFSGQGQPRDLVEREMSKARLLERRTGITAPPGCGSHVEETVMTATQIHHSTVESSHPSPPPVRRVLGGCGVGAAAGATVLLGYGAVAVAAHGPMQAGDPGASHAVPITAASFAIGVLFSSLLGTILAVAIARWATHPARTFMRAAIALGALSLIAPLAASHTTEATRLILAGGHVIAAAVVIPVIVRALRRPA